MVAVYPGGIPATPSRGTNLDDADAHTVWHDREWEELRAGLQELGTNPSGTDATVRARFERLDRMRASGIVDPTAQTTTDATALTIASINTGTFGDDGRVIVWAQAKWTQTVATDQFGLYLQASGIGGNLSSGGPAPSLTPSTVPLVGTFVTTGVAHTISLILVRQSGTGTATNIITDAATQIVYHFTPD